MEVVYCDNCGFKFADHAFADGTAVRAGGKVYCVKCAPTSIEEQKSAVGLPASTEHTSVKNVTKFYFCETCGKRITDRQILEGLGRDKKLKGVYCKECAVGVMTMEFESISEADLRKPVRKSGGNASPAKPPTDAFKAGRTSVRHPESRALKVAAPRPSAEDRFKPAAVGIVVAGVLTVTGTLLWSISSPTRKNVVNEERPAASPIAIEKREPLPTKLEPDPLMPAAPTPEHAPATLPAVPAKTPGDEDRAIAAFEELQRFDGLERNDNAGRIARIDAFLTEHKDSVVSARAQILRKELAARASLPLHNEPASTPPLPSSPSTTTPISSSVADADLLQALLQQTLNSLSQNEIPAALRSVEQDHGVSADARISLKAALEALLKRTALCHEALAKSVGHKVRLETRSGPIDGTILSVEGELLKIDKPLVIDGVVMGSATVTVSYSDILPASRDSVAPLPAPATIDEWMGQALVYLAKQDFDAAETALSHCGGHALQSALRSLESICQAAALEAKAQSLWKKADGLFASKSWKAAQQAYETLQREYARTAVLAANAEILKKRLEDIENSLLATQTINLELGGGAIMELMPIPAGEFEMGSNDGDANEKPVHKVRILRGFCMGKYLVTQAQYEKVIGKNPCDTKGDNLPVDKVNYADAIDFCKKLSKLSGKNVRLPTEAEWEYACRAGTKTAYYIGDNEAALEQAAWYAKNSGLKPHPVGQKKPNAWGLYDMHGCVWQFCQDSFAADYYSKSPAKDPEGPTGPNCVLRGGSLTGTAMQCRSAARGEIWKGDRSFYGAFGFRVVVAAFQAHEGPGK